MKRFAQLEKSTCSLVFQVCHLQPLLIFAILNNPHSVLIYSCLLSVFYPKTRSFQGFILYKATLYDPKKDSKNHDVTTKMSFILGLRYRSDFDVNVSPSDRAVIKF